MATQRCTHWTTEPFLFLYDISITVINMIMGAIPGLQASCHFGWVQPLQMKPCPSMQCCPKMRQGLPEDLCTLSTTADISQQLLHPTLLPAWSHCPSQTLGTKLWLCQMRHFSSFIASLSEISSIPLHVTREFATSCLCCCFLSMVSQASAVTSWFAFGRIVLAAHLHY